MAGSRRCARAADRFIFYAHRGQILHRCHEDQTMQAHCHTLVVKPASSQPPGTCTTPSTRTAAAGHEIGDATAAHLTPARFEAINPYGLLTFEVAGAGDSVRALVQQRAEDTACASGEALSPDEQFRHARAGLLPPFSGKVTELETGLAPDPAPRVITTLGTSGCRF
jgi:Tn3 transposase DDE domain